MQMSGEYGAASFSLDAHSTASGASSAVYGSRAAMQGMQDRAGRMLFPFEDLKPTGSSGGASGDESGGGSGTGMDGGHHQFEQGNKEQQGNGAPGGQDTPVFWNGMIGGGTSW